MRTTWLLSVVRSRPAAPGCAPARSPGDARPGPARPAAGRRGTRSSRRRSPATSASASAPRAAPSTLASVAERHRRDAPPSAAAARPAARGPAVAPRRAAAVTAARSTPPPVTGRRGTASSCRKRRIDQDVEVLLARDAVAARGLGHELLDRVRPRRHARLPRGSRRRRSPARAFRAAVTKSTSHTGSYSALKQVVDEHLGRPDGERVHVLPERRSRRRSGPPASPSWCSSANRNRARSARPRGSDSPRPWNCAMSRSICRM